MTEQLSQSTERGSQAILDKGLVEWNHLSSKAAMNEQIQNENEWSTTTYSEVFKTHKFDVEHKQLDTEEYTVL